MIAGKDDPAGFIGGEMPTAVERYAVIGDSGRPHRPHMPYRYSLVPFSSRMPLSGMGLYGSGPMGLMSMVVSAGVSALLTGALLQYGLKKPKKTRNKWAMIAALGAVAAAGYSNYSSTGSVLPPSGGGVAGCGVCGCS